MRLSRPDLVIGDYKAPLTREKVYPYVIMGSAALLTVAIVVALKMEGVH